jgi:hypothetical protein
LVADPIALLGENEPAFSRATAESSADDGGIHPKYFPISYYGK